MWDEITYPFPTFDIEFRVEVLELISNFIKHFTGHLISYACWNWSKTMLAKGVQ